MPMDLTPLSYWFDYDSFDFDTFFFWGRVLLILVLSWWILRRNYLRKRETEERKLAAATGRKVSEEDPARMSAIVGKLVDKVRGVEQVEQRHMERSRPESRQQEDSDQLLLDRLPSPCPGRCHLVFLNEDGCWVDIKVQGMNKPLTMIGQKILATTRSPGSQLFTITPRKVGQPTKISVSAKDCYCLVELEAGQVKQVCSEHGPMGYDKLKA